MEIQKTGIQQDITNSIMTKKVALDGDKGGMNISDGVLISGKNSGDGKIIDRNFALSQASSGIMSEEEGGSKLLKIASKVCAGFLAAMALVPALAGAQSVAAPQPDQDVQREKVLDNKKSEGIERQVEWKGLKFDVKILPDQNEEKASRVVDFIDRTARDLIQLDNTGEEYLVERDGRLESGGKVDNLGDIGRVGVGSPYQITRSRSVAGTLSYDTETGKINLLYGDVYENVRGKNIKRHVEFEQKDGAAYYKVETEGIRAEVKVDETRGQMEYFEAKIGDQQQDDERVQQMVDFVRLAAEDLKRLDNSPNEYLVQQQDGMLVSGGKVDNLATLGQVGVGTPYQVNRSRAISGTMSYDLETGDMKFFYGDVHDFEVGGTVKKHIEYSEDDGAKLYKVESGGVTREVKIDKYTGRAAYSEVKSKE